MTQAKSLAEFLDHSGARYRVFDLGSQLRKVGKDDWQRFNAGEAYPYPHLGHAWLVLLMWNPDDTDQHSIWFMKLPLDEQAGLPVAVLTDVLNRIHKALATRDPKERQRLLTDHPYQFTPGPGKMAALHARASRLLGAAHSEHHGPARDYLLQSSTTDDWQSLGLQGIADVLERMNDSDARALAKRLPELPPEPRIAVLEALEHHTPALPLVEGIIKQANEHQDPALDTAALRALSQSDATGLVREFTATALNRHPDHLDLVLVVLTRHPGLLEDTDLSLVALDRLAHLADQDGFNRVVQGLALQPRLSGLVLKVLRHPNRSEQLARAIGGLIDASRSVQ
ncbi:DUF3549 family protein [Saccharospirillum salsuginis]|uniref:DUF3549 domain-containing protein n=1 Tax=Saccharospirillum salsuginis TaxID=418750 RepID=A0A918KF08_9GAMM|nr:DUF3549 family protein [Saccharospirillum salsuginis]GGX61405.1 hypothetical protein GCM10007392_31580 [Saccharospirillum salsuginis]